MKVLIMMELRDDFDLNSKADVRIRKPDGKFYYRNKLKLIPLPEKKDYEEPKDDHPYTVAEIKAYTYGLCIGRNQVIEEITK